MLIVQLEPMHNTRGGDWYYRSYSPGRALAELPDVHVVTASFGHRLFAPLVEAADVLVVNMVCDPDLLPVMIERHGRARPTVYEVNDDVGDLQAGNPAAAFFADEAHRALFRLLVKSCDAAQFSTRELERRYRGLHRRREVFENQLAQVPGPPAEREAGRMVVGWGGSAGHVEDVAAVAPALSAWVAEHDDIELRLMCADSIWKLFDGLAAHRKRRVPTGDIEAYHRFVGTLDVGIAPLADRGFNHCRSDVKLLEYASHAVAPVVQRLTPYLGALGDERIALGFSTPVELVAALERLRADPAGRRELGLRAQAYVREHRDGRAWAPRRLAFYRELAGAASVEDRAAELLGRIERAGGASIEGRYVQLEPTRYEQLLHDGLVLGQMRHRPREALACLDEAARLEPALGRPELYAASFAADPLERLRRAVARDPRSVQAWLALGDATRRRGEVEEAVRAYLAAAELAPAFDAAYARCAALLGELGRDDEARRFTALAHELRAAAGS